VCIPDVQKCVQAVHGHLLFGEVFLNEKVRRTLFDTGQVLRTWNSGSYKVGGTLEEGFIGEGSRVHLIW
jgi:hypothetical protein